MIMSVKQAAEYLRVTTTGLRALARDGKIPAAKIGRAWRFHRDDIDAFMRQQYQQVKQEEKAAA